MNVEGAVVSGGGNLQGSGGGCGIRFFCLAKFYFNRNDHRGGCPVASAAASGDFGTAERRTNRFAALAPSSDSDCTCECLSRVRAVALLSRVLVLPVGLIDFPFGAFGRWRRSSASASTLFTRESDLSPIAAAA